MKGRPNDHESVNTFGKLQKYEATEHKEIGDAAFKKLLETYPDIKNPNNPLRKILDPNDCLITVNDHLILSAGEWVALAGDFFGDEAKPITGMPHENLRGPEGRLTRQNRFEAAYLKLANINTKKEFDEVQEILDAIREEDEVVIETLKKRENGENVEVSKELHKHAMEKNKQYAAITAGNRIAKFLIPHIHLSFVGLALYTRYLELLKTNFDHFGDDALLAYEAGHEVALNTALSAAREQDQTESAKQFVKALTQELFAAHFLSDAFASGHLRVPRRELYAKVRNKNVAGLLANVMHNEDGEKGLNVESERSKLKGKNIWLAKGDGCLFDQGTEKNHKKAIKAVFRGLESIYRTYLNPNEVYKFNARAHRLQAVDSNHPPLFRVENDLVEYRGAMSPDDEPNYTGKWYGPPTLINLWLFKPGDTDLSESEGGSLSSEESEPPRLETVNVGADSTEEVRITEEFESDLEGCSFM